LQIGEFDAAINSILQAMEFYPENAELEYRLAGIYYFLSDPIKGKFHLENALKLESDYSMILEILFPSVFDLTEVKNLIEQHRKTSL
jgi:tetratricopeptide (TPR) repeat protein